MQSDTASLGRYLRQERERRQVALHDISAATKIQMRFLEALEADQHDQLPPLPFAVGFVRAYAQCLGLEPDAIVAGYRAMHRVPEEPDPRVMHLQPAVRPPKRWRAAAIGVLVIAIGLLTGRLWYEPTPDRHVVKVDVPFTSEPLASRQEGVASPSAVSVSPLASVPGTPVKTTQTPVPSAHTRWPLCQGALSQPGALL
jgi:cytoskeletal protein RodZ